MKRVALHNIDTLNDYECAVSRLGYNIPTFNSEFELLDQIHMVDDVGEIRTLETRNIKTNDWELNEAIKTCAKQVITEYMPGTVINYWRAMGHFCREYNAVYTGKELTETELLLIIKKGINRDSQESNKFGVVLLLQEAFLLEVPGFTIELLTKIKNKKYHSTNKHLRMLFQDPDRGPFVANEMAFITELINERKLPTESRVIISICSDYGVRPIQLALLREEDFIYDDDYDEYFLKIPRVKQGDQFRREQFSKRILDLEQTRLIKKLILENKKRFSFESHQFARPLFFRIGPGPRNGAKALHDFYRGKSEYAHHIGPGALRSRFQHQVKPFLPISPRTGNRLKINIYRFRYTVAHNAVLDGYSEAELADLLDHTNVRSVRWYFKMSAEVHYLLDEVISKRIEQRSFVDAWKGDDTLPENIYASDILEEKTLAKLGKCTKRGFCPYEPGIACYACYEKNFFPNRDLEAHKKAKEIIDERIAELLNTSTGKIPEQLLNAKIGNQKAIRFAEGQDL